MKKGFLLALGCALTLSAATLAPTDWKTYGNDPGQMRFSTLTQITPENVQHLTKAWEFDTKSPKAALPFWQGKGRTAFSKRKSQPEPPLFSMPAPARNEFTTSWWRPRTAA